MTYKIGTMGLTTKELTLANGEKVVMTLMDGNFVANNGELSLTQAPSDIPAWRQIP